MLYYSILRVCYTGIYINIYLIYTVCLCACAPALCCVQYIHTYINCLLCVACRVVMMMCLRIKSVGILAF